MDRETVAAIVNVFVDSLASCCSGRMHWPSVGTPQVMLRFRRKDVDSFCTAAYYCSSKSAA